MRYIVSPILQIILIVALFLSFFFEGCFRNGFIFFGFKNSGLLFLWLLQSLLVLVLFTLVTKRLVYFSKIEITKWQCIINLGFLFCVFLSFIALIISRDEIKHIQDRWFFEQNGGYFEELLVLARETECFQHEEYCHDELILPTGLANTLQSNSIFIINADDNRVLIVPNHNGYYPIVRFESEPDTIENISIGRYDLRCLTELAELWYLCTGSL